MYLFFLFYLALNVKNIFLKMTNTILVLVKQIIEGLHSFIKEKAGRTLANKNPGQCELWAGRTSFLT